jgi:plasmid stabilization system protein ParE
MSKREIIWTKTSVRQFAVAIEYVRKESDQRAQIVRRKILEKISQLSDPIVSHRADPLKKNNVGRYLFFQVLKFRIVYYSGDKKVYIVRIRHTSMEPRKY